MQKGSGGGGRQHVIKMCHKRRSLLLGRLKYAPPGVEEAESRRAADTAAEASWRSHASGSGGGGGLAGAISWGAGCGGDGGRTPTGNRAAGGREAHAPRLAGACGR
jgi:hypothetical protein